MKTIKQRLADKEIIMACGLGRIPHHNFIQILGMQGGFQAVWFDQEHTGVTMEQIEVGALAARSFGMDSFVRVAPTDYAVVTRSIEAGSSGVMVAQVQNAEHAEQIVKWTKYAPRGYRGLNSSGYDGKYGTVPLAEFCAQSNRDTFLAIQIETLSALNDSDAIAAIDGVDVLFVGPADLGQSMGLTGDFFNPKCIEALDKVGAACKKHGKNWGVVTVNPAYADMVVEKGCRILSPTSDNRLLNMGIKATKGEYSKYFTA
ncbi:MAG: HpcH/HpaI aldolase family protein [Planctomycetaceae bacterium]